MRTEKELWELVLSRTYLFETGLCKWISALLEKGYLRSEEFWRLRGVLEINLPRRKGNMHSWPPFHIEPRIEWIKNRIKQLEDENKS